jgi:D-alanyl-D-alanine carboxypeptidase
MGLLTAMITFLFLFSFANSASALAVPEQFIKLAASRTLASPGVLLVDPTNQQTLFSLDPDVQRAPASVLKLLSMASVLSAYSPDLQFQTTISATDKSDTFLLTGSDDPWLTQNSFEEQQYGRAFSPSLIDSVLKLHPELKSITLEYKDLYTLDIQALQRYFAGRVTITPVKVNSTSDATTEIGSIHSPTLAKIIEFTLLYSDNALADRLARMAAKEMGFTTDAAGLESSFTKTLTDLGITATGIHIFDGNGLSHQDRVSARQILQLLLAIKGNPKFQPILEGLPTSGKTGTLKYRFVNDAPNAVGLVHAKTGWINTTISLAGFVTVGTNEYVFAIIANHIRNLESARQAARVTIDQMLGTIAKPQK